MQIDLRAQAFKAFEALQILTKKEEDTLIAEDPTVTLVFTLWEPYESSNPFPSAIAVRHSLYTDSTLPVVAITKDPHADWKGKFKDLPLPFPIKSYSVSKFRKRFAMTYDARQLIKETRFFVADSCLGHVLGSSMAQDFFEKKKMPFLLDFATEDISASLDKLMNSSYIVLPKHNSTKFASPIGKISWSQDEIADNAADVINAVFEKIGQDKIATIHIRIPSSTTIPIYNADISSFILLKE